MSLLTFIPFIKSKFKIPQQVISESWDVRDTILGSGVNLFCWKRPVDIVISNYLGQLLEKELKPIKFYTDVSNLDRKIGKARLDWDQEPVQAADLFWKDVSLLIQDFLQYAGR